MKRVLFIVMLLSSAACASQPRFPLVIENVSISSSPIVGQVVTLQVEIISSKDEPDTTIQVYLPDGINLISGKDNWQGALSANQPYIHELDICILVPGEWFIDTSVRSQLSQTSSYGDTDTLIVNSALDSAKVIRGFDYTYTQPPPNSTVAPIPSPVEVSDTCSK